MARSLITVILPDGSSVAQVWTWSDIGIVDWTEFFRPLADCLAGVDNAEWSAKPLREDETDKAAISGH